MGWGRTNPSQPTNVVVTADVIVKSARSAIKYCVNGEPVSLAVGTPVSWGVDGKIYKASAADEASTDAFCGIVGEPIAPGVAGLVYRTGWVANALEGMGAITRMPVFLGVIPGTLSLEVPPPGYLIFKVGVAEPPDGVAGLATDLWIDKTTGYVN